MKVVIIGGVAGGASAAARLRRLDENAEIVLLERGPFISFANCGLPYYIGGVIREEKRLTLQTPESFHARFRVDVRVNSEAVGVDPRAKAVSVRNLRTGETYTESYDKLILSPGAAPVKPPVPGTALDGVFTLRNIPDTLRIKGFIKERKPKSALIVGGGYIGVEMAENLARQGIRVTIAELADHLIAPLDFDMAADVHRYAREKGVTLLLENGLAEITGTGPLTAKLQKGTCTADMVILAVGVRPDTAFLRESGVKLDERGAILVNEGMQTSEPEIYAVGDGARVQNFMTGKPAFLPLAGPANRQGRIAADNLCGIQSRYTGTQGSAVLQFFDMTICATGLNEKACEAAGIAFDKAYLYSPSHATYYPGFENLSLKVLWDKKSLRLLGAQITGFAGADKRMDVLAAAIRFGAKVTELASLELCYAPPYGSAKDPVNMAGFVAENVISGKVKQFFWHDVAGLPRDGSAVLLDVRTDMEVARGKIQGFIHIPLDSLRQRLEELPRGKPVYIHCHSGLRSYIACRILSQRGFDCYNLAGGFRLYESVAEERAVPDYICTECR